MPPFDVARLALPPAAGGLRLVRLSEAHRAGLHAACAEDPEIWSIYVVSFAPEHFHGNFASLVADPHRIAFALFQDDVLAGMSAFIAPDARRQVVEIGNTYLRPSLRGTGLNARLKRLMLDHAFACGARRVEFRIDDRNARSKTAVAKIGGVFEGLLRADRITWTGHVRDTALFSILAEEWQR